MSGCVQSCFNSFISSPVYKEGVKFKNHVWRYFKTAEGRDKAFKFADPFLESISEISKATGAPKDTIDGLAKGRSWTKAGRDANALFNVVGGVLDGVIDCSKNIFNLVYYGLYKGETVALREPERESSLKPGVVTIKEKREDGTTEEIDRYRVDGTYFHKPDALPNLVAVKPAEKIWALVSNIGNGLGAATYAFGFGVCRVIDNLHKYVRDAEGRPLIQMSEAAIKLGHSFSTVMMFNHIGGFVGGAGEIVYQYLAYDRAKENGDRNLGKAYEEFEKRVIENVVGVLEKFLELIMDIVNLVSKAAPAWFRLPMNLGIGICAIGKQWLKTA